MTELSDIKRELVHVRTVHSRSVAIAAKYVKGVLITAGALVAGVSQFMTAGGAAPSAAKISGIFACIIIFLGGLFVLATEQDASDAVKVADRAVEAARDAEERMERINDLADEMERLAQTYQLCLTMRGALEQSGIGRIGSIDDTIAALFELVARPLSIACGFAQSDRWTIGIYRAVPAKEAGKAELRCIAHDRAMKCPIDEARSWPEGVGIAGIAYTNQREIVIPDLRAEGVKAVFGPRGLKRDYDAERYVSMVAVPIIVAGRAKPWGVVNATSNQAGHFAASSNPGFKFDEPIRALAAFAALAVAMRDAQDSAGTALHALATIKPDSAGSAEA